MKRRMKQSHYHSLPKRLWYNFLHWLCRLASVALFRIRVYGRNNLPSDGAVLICSNHQSHFDPVLVGMALDRRLNFLARRSLFRFAPFRWLIQSLDAIPIEREGTGFGGLKETLRRIKRGEAVLLFPEGTRSPDGALAPLKSGVLVLARRGKAPLLPVAISGAFESWPRQQPLPYPSVIYIRVGRPISFAEAEALDDGALLAELERRMHACHVQARGTRLRAITTKRAVDRR